MKRFLTLTSLLTGMFLIGANALADHHEAKADVEYLSASSEVENTLPFSDAVRVADVLYVSGKIGNIPGSLDLAPGGIQGETRQALENIKASVERYGFSMARPIKCTVFLADIAEWGKMNEIYVQFFPGNKPARSAFGASGLALNSRVEIECMFAR
ncbi:MAG: Rid family hydrolase [Gammaproteobacteria bacterium]|nr:Rid family hydrolase [Gammaproteobacteria bacterium]